MCPPRSPAPAGTPLPELRGLADELPVSSSLHSGPPQEESPRQGGQALPSRNSLQPGPDSGGTKGLSPYLERRLILWCSYSSQAPQDIGLELDSSRGHDLALSLSRGTLGSHIYPNPCLRLCFQTLLESQITQLEVPPFTHSHSTHTHTYLSSIHTLTHT